MRDITRFDAEQARKDNYIGKRISAARRDAGMSQGEFCAALAARGVSVTDKSLSKWELGTTVPNVYQLMAVCHVLKLRDLLTEYEPELNDAGIRKLAEYKADLIASGRYAPASLVAEAEYIEMPVCYLPASAGPGAFLDDDAYELLSFPRIAVPEGAERGIRVSGDSMEPVFHDGQIAWMQSCNTLHPGEVGIFRYGDEGFIKVYEEQEPDDPDAFTDSDGAVRMQPVLVSLNPKYEPRVISPNMEFQIFGRVLR